MKLIVLAKSPVAGRVKTRLCPPLTHTQAAAVAAAALADTLAAVRHCGADERVLSSTGRLGTGYPLAFGLSLSEAGR